VGEEVVSHDAQEMNKNPLQGDFSLPRTQNAPSVNSEMNGFKREANCPNARGGRPWCGVSSQMNKKKNWPLKSVEKTKKKSQLAA